ncbi:PREDICTED: sodium channel and clathrin linker 1-like [Acropora digitifera]|uniref:sodium channel and clathrin linker 1-like n=1 Tax=Acropora digitifera TaxID=70779 RepID=UPI00077A1A4E|nr:PREDICTED: sodium channel and clathrin linker 1-like [Acropora digitifera]
MKKVCVWTEKNAHAQTTTILNVRLGECEIDNLKRELLSAKQVKEQAQHQCVTEVESLKQQHEVREKEFETRLRGVEEMNRRSVNELREMLTAQQKLGAQWKEESQAVTHKFEQTVNELR